MNKENALPEYPQLGVATTCRSFDEYCAMFNVEPSHWAGPVLDVAGGASSFTAQLRARGVAAMAADPFYEGLTDEAIAAGYREIDTSAAKIAAMSGMYDWSYYGSPEQQRLIREQSMALFAEDCRKDDAGSRYFAASLPNLPFESDKFERVVCSHFLFLYGEALGKSFHAAALPELIRVLRPGGELRVYPLVTLKWEKPAYLSELLSELEGVATWELLPTGLPFLPIPSPLLRLQKIAF
ncbi:class I SAM-dependent methyltransferase [Cohnella boryungensis]|uniref:Class I SAM-dependent methyltransferase n=1 Tax=Cohnella boryungensis TaxID=768479 RepID=A0ABV8SF12_9BACL